MSFIIVWRNSHKDPHINIDFNDFKEDYPTPEAAKAAAEEIYRTENEDEESPWYFDFAIYEDITKTIS